MKNFLTKIFCLITISAYILSPLSVWADDIVPETGEWMVDPETGQTNPSAADAYAPSSNESNPPASAQDRLKKETQADRQQCNQKFQFGGNQAQKPGTLSSMLSDAFRNSLANHIDDFISNKLPSLLEQNIGSKLPGFTQESIRAYLPSRVQNTIYKRYPNSNPTKEQLQAIVKEATDAITQEAIRDGTKRITRNTISQNLPQYLSDAFSADAESVINGENSEYAKRVKEAVDELANQAQKAKEEALKQLAIQLVQTLADQAMNGAKAETLVVGTAMPFAQSLFSLVLSGATADSLTKRAGDNMNMTFNQEQKDELVKIILQSTASSTVESLQNSGEIDEIADGLSTAINAVIITDLVNQATASFGQWTSGSQFQGAMGDVGRSFDSTLGGLTGQKFDLSGGLSGELLNPIVKASLPGVALYSTTFTKSLMSGQGFIGGLHYADGGNGTSVFYGDNKATYTVDSSGNMTEGVNTADAEYNTAVQADPQSAIETYDLKPSADVAPPSNVAATDAAANSAQSSAATNGGQATSDAVSKSSAFSGMGDAMKGALPGIAGGMVGDLVGNIPVVGGLLAPIAETAVTSAVAALLGVPLDAVLGILVTDPGLASGVSQGFKAMGKAIGEVIKRGDKSNANEEHLNKTQDESKTLLAEMCVKERIMARTALHEERDRDITIPDAAKANTIGLFEQFKTYLTFLSRGYRMSSAPGGPQKNGQPFVQPTNKIVKDRTNEQEIKSVAEEQGSGAPFSQEVARAMKVMNESKEPRASITEGQWNKMKDPAQAAQLTDEEWSTGITTIYSADRPNSPVSRFLVKTGQQEAAKSKVAQQAINEQQRNGGSPDPRTCTDWVPEDIYNGGEGYCRGEWVPTSYGSVLLSLLGVLASAWANQSNRVFVGSDFINKVPNPLDRFTNLADNPAANPIAQKTSNVGSDPCPDPGGCPKSGWQTNQIDTQAMGQALEKGMDHGFDSLNSLFSGLDNQDYTGGSGENSGNNLPDFQMPDLGGFLPTASSAKIIKFYANPDKNTVEWQTSDAFVCQPTNDWTGTENDIKQGDALSENGEEKILDSIDINSLDYKLRCLDFDMVGTKETTITK